MKRLIFIIVLLAIISTTMTAEAESIFLINNQAVEVESKIIKGRTMVPARLINSYFKEKIEWEQKEKRLLILANDYKLKIRANERVAVKDKQPLPLDIAPRLINKQLFIPVRLLTQLYGGQLSWSAEDKAINYRVELSKEDRKKTIKKDKEKKQKKKPVVTSSIVSRKRRKEQLNRKNQLKFNNVKVVIDPGHGGIDPGAIGVTGLREKDVNLEISMLLQRKLIKMGYNPILTRSNDRFISLSKRAHQANLRDADLFISIHANFNTKSWVNGTATYAHWYASKENWAAAWYIQSGMIRRISLKDNGLKAANFAVLRETDMPAVLVETAFLSNQREEKLLDSASFQDKVATGIAAGVEKYFQEKDKIKK